MKFLFEFTGRGVDDKELEDANFTAFLWPQMILNYDKLTSVFL